MSYVFALAGIGLVVALILGFIGRRIDRARQEGYDELQDHYESLSETRKADDLLRDPKHVKRMRDTFND